MKTRLIDEMQKEIEKKGGEAVVQNCLHCGQDIKLKEFVPAYCPHCGREPDPPLGYLLELAKEGKLAEYLRD